ncbi:phospholipase D family protein [Salsipaludibacter albus]|uniref:phospholipase D family protein n=1 Tax=Salsipaludibacter albus TaxID=2849650 RepID=UPI001EE4DBD9|nr:phospholipase D family protein [Salsipaludibacter albus]MBY5162063.1 phospholipase D family protein [Salsipaludibacter albus]
MDVDCRLFNPSRGTFHPKVTLVRRDGEAFAMVGSANITAGLVRNVEADVVVGGSLALDVEERVRSWWESPEAKTWEHPGGQVQDVISVELWALLRAALRPESVVHTVSSRKPNRIAQLNRAGLWVETERSRRLGREPELVEPWMLDVAWAALVADGELSNTRLLNDLRVHRSSFVCAVLSELPGVEVASRRPIRLVLDTAVSRTNPVWPGVAADLDGGYDVGDS